MDNAEQLQQLQKKLKEGKKGGALSNEKVAYSKWLRENTGIKVENGKRTTVWKTGSNVGKLFNPKEGNKVFFTGYYGTATPYKDLKYLQQAELINNNISKLRRNKLRIRTSKVDYKGDNIFLQEVDAREKKELEQLEKLRKGTSFDVLTEDKAQKDILQIFGKKTPSVQVNGKDLPEKNKKDLAIQKKTTLYNDVGNH